MFTSPIPDKTIMKSIVLYAAMSSLTLASPGPGVLLTITNTLNYGFQKAAIGIVGIVIGMGAIALLATSSLGIIIVSSPSILNTLRIFGAIYLIYLSYKMLRSDARISNIEYPDLGINKSNTLIIREAILVTFSNPKAIAFFIFLFPQFINGETGFVVRFMLLTLIFCIILVIIHLTYSIIANFASQKLTEGKSLLVANRIGGTVFLLFSMFLLYSAYLSLQHIYDA